MPGPNINNLPLPAQLATADLQEKWLWRINKKLIDAHNAAGTPEARKAILRKQKNILNEINKMRNQGVDENGDPISPSLKAEGMIYSDHDADIDLDLIEEQGN